MTDKNSKFVTINDKNYTEDQLTDEQKVILNHIKDLELKIRSAQFNLDQLNVGKEAFVSLLTKSLEAPVEEAA